MLFRQLIDTETHTYSYLLADQNTGEGIIIDPVITHVAKYLQLLNELGIQLTVSIDTHTHADHITAASALKVKTGCMIIQGKESPAKGISRHISEGECIEFGQHALKAIHTPGHTPDSYSYFLASGSESKVFTGDTLLIRGTGRTDFQEGSCTLQYESLFNKLLQLPEETAVYPGHDYKGWTVSTIAEEKRHNPRLQVNSINEYKEIMDNLNLAPPKMITTALPANLNCGGS